MFVKVCDLKTGDKFFCKTSNIIHLIETKRVGKITLKSSSDGYVKPWQISHKNWLNWKVIKFTDVMQDLITRYIDTREQYQYTIEGIIEENVYSIRACDFSHVIGYKPTELSDPCCFNNNSLPIDIIAQQLSQDYSRKITEEDICNYFLEYTTRDGYLKVKLDQINEEFRLLSESVSIHRFIKRNSLNFHLPLSNYVPLDECPF